MRRPSQCPTRPPARRRRQAHSNEAGGRALAEMKWRECKAWRNDTEMETVFARPAPVFHLFKKLYPHAFHGRTHDGLVRPLGLRVRGSPFRVHRSGFEV